MRTREEPAEGHQMCLGGTKFCGRDGSDRRLLRTGRAAWECAAVHCGHTEGTAGHQQPQCEGVGAFRGGTAVTSGDGDTCLFQAEDEGRRGPAGADANSAA